MDGVYGWRLEEHLEGAAHHCARCGVHQAAMYRRRLVSTDWQDEDTVLCFGCFQQRMAQPLHPLPRSYEHRLHPNGDTTSTGHP